jgi:diguanylate cyclase (GGDEF)-like protein
VTTIIESITAPSARAAVASVSRAFALLVLAVLLAVPAAHAEQMLFSRLGSEAGLSQGSVLAMQQDVRGFMWIGTEDGLIRYDGYDLQHVVRDRKDPESLPNNWVSALAIEPGTGRLWVATEGGGIAWRDSSDGRFRAPAGKDGKPLVDPQSRVRSMMFDSRGRLWLGTRGAGVQVLDLATHSVRTYRHDAEESALSDDSVFQMLEDGEGRVWVATQSGLDRIAVDGRVEYFAARLRALVPGAANVKVNALRLDDRGTLWIGTDSGLFHHEPATGALAVLRHAATDPTSLPDDRVLTLLQDRGQRLWVGTFAGLSLLDRRNLRFETYRHDPADSSSLPDNYIVSLYEDASGLLWVGTKSGGIARWNPRSWSFGHHRIGAAAGNVTSFVEDSRGVTWIGTFGEGLFALDRRTGVTKRYGRTGAESIGDDNVMALTIDARDRVWVATMRAGVTRIDARTGRVDRFEAKADDPESLPAPGVMSLLHDSRGNVWVGTFGGGVARIDGSTDRVRRYPTVRGSDGDSADRATALAEDHAGLIWIGTDGGGLDVLDPATGAFRRYAHSPSDPRSVSANTVYAIHVDAQGRVWVGTRSGGLDLAIGAPLSRKGLQFENYSEAEGLPNSTVYGVESDGAGRLWLSTNRGLARFDVRRKAFTGFRRSHGLQGDEFNFGSHYRSPSGELFFGGANGYNAFYPDRLSFNERAPAVVLTDVLKLNLPAKLGAEPDALDRVHFDYRDDVLTFRFAALDFTAPAENRYQYKLEGFDPDWVQAGTNRQVTYTNLDGGRYVFRVRAANSDGAWSDDSFALKVNVDSPPWATWWAYGLYTLAGLLALWSVWAAQQRRLEREAAFNRRLQLEVDARTAELALRNDQLHVANRQLREASVTDPLTGLGNRRALHETIDSMLNTARAGDPNGIAGTRFVLMVIDLDRLKPINDQHGHEAGDRVLTQVAESLRTVSRSSDTVVRWGGDEFVMLCRDADMVIASTLAERVRAALAKQIFRVGDGAVARTSCSIGFAPYPFVPEAPEHLDWEDSLALADAALYDAKRTRNSWVGWSGTRRTPQVPKLLEAVERDPGALEKDGFLDVRRRSPTFDDTVDNMVAFKSTDR